MFNNISMKGKLVIGAILLITAAMFLYTLENNGGSETTLQSFYDKHDVQKERLFKDITGKENDTVKPSAEIVDNELIMTYTYKLQVDAKKESSALDAKYEENHDSVNKEASKMIKLLGEKTGINANRITMTTRYVNKDGSEIYSRTFSKNY